MSESIAEIQFDSIPESMECPACDKGITKSELNVTAFADYITIPLQEGKILTVFGTFHAECLEKYTNRFESKNLIKPEFLIVAIQKLATVGGV